MHNIHKEIINIKELLYFYDTINSLNYIKKNKKIYTDNRINIILSSDDNYSCFVATTGCSILYNTSSFIEFYIISDGITLHNKNRIVNSFRSITDKFSIKFIEINSKVEFKNIFLDDNYHVKLNTCNRLLFPIYETNIDKVIYLDVDTIVREDIINLWNKDLCGHIIGAVPIIIERDTTIDDFRKKAHIPEDKNYLYFNSGVMIIDYKMWRQKKYSNENIVHELKSILSNINAIVTPDELVLNNFCYYNYGYKKIDHKWNVNSYFSYDFLKKNNIDKYKNETLNSYNNYIKKYNLFDCIDFGDNPSIVHYFSHEKPWNTLTPNHLPIDIIAYFKEFWFYASMTLFFDDIKNIFVKKRLNTNKYNISKYEYIKKYLFRIFS